MDDIGHPTQLLDSLKYTTGEENGTFTIIRIILAILVFLHLTLAEVVVVVDEVDLDPGWLDRGDLDNQRMVRVVNDKVHSW